MTNENTEISVSLKDLPIERELLAESKTEMEGLPTIKSKEDYTLHSVASEKANKLLIEHEKRRKNMVKPVNDAVKRLNAAFKEAVAPVKKLLDESRAKRTAYDTARMKREQTLMDKKGEEGVATIKQATHEIGSTAKYVTRRTYQIQDLGKVVANRPPKGNLTGATDLDDYIAGLKKELRRLVEDNTPVDGMVIVEQSRLQDR